MKAFIAYIGWRGAPAMSLLTWVAFATNVTESKALEVEALYSLKQRYSDMNLDNLRVTLIAELTEQSHSFPYFT